MEQKPKRKGTPRRPYLKLGIIAAVLIILISIISVVVVNFTTLSNDDRIHITPVDSADVPLAQNLMQNPEIDTQSQMGHFISISMMSAQADRYLCLDVLPGALVEVNLAKLTIRANGAPVPYYANTGVAPVNCVLLQASFEPGWYIFEVDIPDATNRQIFATYRWGVELK
jgi:hypothetical protein